MISTQNPAKLALGLLWRTIVGQIACGFVAGILIGLASIHSTALIAFLLILAAIVGIWLGVHTNNPKESNLDSFSGQTITRTIVVFLLWFVGEVINLFTVGVFIEAGAPLMSVVVGTVLCYGFLWLAGVISYATMPIKFLPPKASKKAQVQA